MFIDPDIRSATTLPGSFYSDPEVFGRVRERVFPKTWHLVGDLDALKAPGQCLATSLVGEPVLLTRDAKDGLHCVSNVCTHRGNLVCEGTMVQTSLRCRYHGRRFGLDGKFLSMPEFEGVEGFPGPGDDLPRVPHAAWSKLVFASLEPAMPFAQLAAELYRRVAWLPIGDAVLDRARSRDYELRANWALYCDNYLEGFHVPFVHAGLAETLEYGSYRTELQPFGTLQIGIAKDGEATFDLPASSPDAGAHVAGYYFWLFPTTMLNVYPWGVSVNVVRPLAVDRTRVSFLSYVWDPSKVGTGASSDLHRVELEDEAVVESVQQGVRARLYRHGRYSPKREAGVHHFHRLLLRFLEETG